MTIKQRLVTMSPVVMRLIVATGLLILSVCVRPVLAYECSFQPDNQSQILSAGTFTVTNFNPSNTALTLLGSFPQIRVALLECGTGNDGADWYGWTDVSNTAGVKSGTYQGTGYSYYRVFWPTNIPGIYYSVNITDPNRGSSYKAYLPDSTSETRLLDFSGNNDDTSIYATIEIWQYGTVTAVGDAHPTQTGLIGTFRAGSLDNGDSEKLKINVNASSFTVKFTTPTCNLSVSPTTIDFGDVGNDKPRKTFTLKNSNCVNASGVTLKLTSTKAAYDNSGLSILANTTTGTSAAGGRGVAVSYEGSSRQYLSANDTNSSVSIDFGSIVTAKDITMAGLLTCTSASNNSTCDDYTPGAFTAVGTLSATYK
ncbi:pilus assembly protein FimA [Citrobacter youngae]|uniref:pilus assembly protein FimA n=1 Tax=Citrobacter TaxID=544 RepID=UPI00143D9E15|nr:MULTISPECIES: pilus assembly protein FimA [Citrobacter]MDU5628356.1 pilus assembly protein FimA [Citrobacter sp.]